MKVIKDLNRIKFQKFFWLEFTLYGKHIRFQNNHPALKPMFSAT